MSSKTHLSVRFFEALKSTAPREFEICANLAQHSGFPRPESLIAAKPFGVVAYRHGLLKSGHKTGHALVHRWGGAPVDVNIGCRHRRPRRRMLRTDHDTDDTVGLLRHNQSTGEISQSPNKRDIPADGLRAVQCVRMHGSPFSTVKCVYIRVT